MAAFDPTTDTLLLLDASAGAPARMLPGRFLGATLAVSASFGKSVTDSGIALTIPNASNWDVAYGWGNHAAAGYVLGSLIGAASGIAPLGADAKIAATYLPATVLTGAALAAAPLLTV